MMNKLKKTCLEGLPQKVSYILLLLHINIVFSSTDFRKALFHSASQPRILDFALSLFHFASSALRISAIKRAQGSHDNQVAWASWLPSNVEIWIQSSKLQFKTPHPGEHLRFGSRTPAKIQRQKYHIWLVQKR